MALSTPKISRVTDRVHCVQRRDYLSCSYVVLREEDVVLIDAGIDPTGGDVLAALEAIGRNVLDVSAILMTHWHNDHSGGAGAIQEASGCAVHYHESSHGKFTREKRIRGVRGYVASKLPGAGFWSSFRGLLELAPPRAVAASAFVADGQRILEDFKVIGTPGHESGHLSYYYEPDRVLFAGDAVAVAHDRIVFMSRFLTEDRDAGRSSILRCLDVDSHAICPGHRYPLIGITPSERDRARQQVENMRWWPIIGC